MQLFTRSGQDWAARLVPVARACAALPARTAWLDGEIVVFEDGGRTRFEALQEALSNRGDTGALRYVVFDLLHHDGADLRWVPLERRKQRLAALLRRAGQDTLVYGDHVIGRGDRFLRQACAHGLEGVVSKRRDSRYREGRGADWQKIRCGQRGGIRRGRLHRSRRDAHRTGRAPAGGLREPGAARLRRTCGHRLRREDAAQPAPDVGRHASSRTRRSCPSPTCHPARTGCGRTWSPRYASPTGRATVACVTRCSSACARTSRQRR